MTTNEKAKAKELLDLVASGDAIELKFFWLGFTSGNGIELAMKQRSFSMLCSLFGSDEKGAVRLSAYCPHRKSRIDIRLRANTLCYICEQPSVYILVGDQIEFIHRDNLPEGYNAN